MGIYDIAMLAVFGGAIFFGYWKGLAWQIASLAALIVSYIVAVNFRDPVAQLIQVDAPWNRIGAMLILFLGTSLVIWTIYASVSKNLKKHELKGFDRQAGAVLGAAKGAILCMVITMFSVSILGESAHEAVDNSRLGQYVEKGIWQISDYVPAEIARFVDPHIQSYKEASEHGEPEIDHEKTIEGLFDGSAYAVEQPMNQDPNQLPPSNQPSYQNSGYSGTWQTSTTPATGVANQQPPATNQSYQFGTNYGAPPPKNQTSNWNQGNSTGGYQGGFQTQTTGSDFSNLNVSDASRRILERAGQQVLDKGFEAANQTARQWLDGRQPSQNTIAETAQQFLDEARRRGMNMTLESATEAARKWLDGGQPQ